MPKLAQLLAKLDSDREVRQRQFVEVCRWYLESAPHYRPLIARARLWDDWPGRWKADAGIDLIAETHQRQLWAVQAVAGGGEEAISAARLERFFEESDVPEVAFRLIVAESDHLGRTEASAIRSQSRPAAFCGRSDLERVELAWPRSPDRLEAEQPAVRRPQPYQRRAVAAVLRGFEAADRGQLITLPGTDEILTTLWVAERLQSKRTLVLLSSLSQLYRTVLCWTANRSRSFDYLAVGCDERDAGEDHWIRTTSELGFPVTENPEHVAALVRRKRPLVVFASYRAADCIAEATFGHRLPAFDLAIATDAHRCAGETTAGHAMIVDADEIEAHRRLFTTATPTVFGEPRIELDAADVAPSSLRDEELFGPVFHRIARSKATPGGLGSGYRVAIVGVDEARCQSVVEACSQLPRHGKQINVSRNIAGQLGLTRAMRRYDLRRVVSFHSGNDRARDFSAELADTLRHASARWRPKGPLSVGHISPRTTRERRARLFEALNDLEQPGRMVVTNARCLCEADAVPAVDGIALIEPECSPCDLIDVVEHGLRTRGNRHVVTVIAPVLIETEKGIAAALQSSAMAPLWQLMRALRACDAELATALDTLREELGRGAPAGISLPEGIEIDLPGGVGKAFVRALKARLVEQASPSWMFFFGLLRRFIEREGHSAVPPTHRERGYKLGAWVDEQRSRRAELPEPYRRKLKGLAGWRWERQTDPWLAGLSAIARFIEREGHTDVPDGHVEQGIRLGPWVKRQRLLYHRGKLHADRRAALEEVPGWVWHGKLDGWELRLAQVRAFARREGHTRVPKDEVVGGFSLGRWVTEQRTRSRLGRLTSRQVSKLESIEGWLWDPWETAWENGLAHLRRFVAREGHARVDEDHIEDGYKLGQWVKSQRTLLRSKMLREDRVQALERVPGWLWDPYRADWEEGFDHLLRFVAREGHARVEEAHLEDGYKLGQWVRVQRRLHKHGGLDSERADRLEQLAGWVWSVREAAWENGLAHLRRFVEREGHARVPSKHLEAGFHLGRWVVWQRQRRARGRMPPERERTLEAFVGWVWSTRRSRR